MSRRWLLPRTRRQRQTLPEAKIVDFDDQLVGFAVVHVAEQDGSAAKGAVRYPPLVHEGQRIDAAAADGPATVMTVLEGWCGRQDFVSQDFESRELHAKNGSCKDASARMQLQSAAATGTIIVGAHYAAESVVVAFTRGHARRHTGPQMSVCWP